MAFIIACASSKGGCGKTTLAVAMAGVYASNGSSVLLLDADTRKRLEEEWYNAKSVHPMIKVLSVGADDISKVCQANQDTFDVIIIDVEGSANWALAKALMAADFTLIPAKVSYQDVKDAWKVYETVKGFNDESRRYRHCWIIWNGLPPAIRSREMTNTMAEAVRDGLPVLAAITELDAFRALFSYQTTLDVLKANTDPETKIPSAKRAEAEIAHLITLMHDKMSEKQTEEAA